MFHDVMRTGSGAEGREYESVSGISVFLGKLGSAVVSSDFGALGESESDTFLRDFLAGAAAGVSSLAASVESCDASAAACFGEVADVVSVAFRFDLVVVGAAEAAEVDALDEALAVAVAVRLEERRPVVEDEAAGAIVLNGYKSRVWYLVGVTVKIVRESEPAEKRESINGSPERCSMPNEVLVRSDESSWPTP